MILLANVDGEMVMADLMPISISLPVAASGGVSAFHLPPATFEPFRAGSFIGSREEGGSAQCHIVTMAPHGNGTHTECIGHLAGNGYRITEHMPPPLAEATLISVDVMESGRGLAITRESLNVVLPELRTSALVIRTLPNTNDKRVRQWSGSHPPFITPEAMAYLVQCGVEHLVVDVPSVDPEEDGGALEAHHIFWQWPNTPRLHCTITELAYIPNSVPDGRYIICFGVAPLESDAAPSNVLLFRLLGQRDESST